MEFQVNKADLVRELSLSQGVVEKKTTIPILANVLIEAHEDRLELTASDLELSIRCSCAAEVKRTGSGTVPAKRLLEYVRLLPDVAVQVKFAENYWLSLVCGRSRTRIAGMSRESFPELPKMPDPIGEIPIRLLQSLISRTVFSISTEDSRFTLNGALLLVKPDRIAMVATDGHRLALCEGQVTFQREETQYRALVPRKAMLELMRLSGELDPATKIEFAGDENHLFFKAGHRLLISRKLTGNFPDFDRVLPPPQPHKVTLPREEFRATIDRVAQFSDERSHAVRLALAPGELQFSSSLSDTGETEEAIPVAYDGPPIEIGFNAQYLADFLRAANEEEVTLSLRDSGSAGELTPAGENLQLLNRYVVMPMRI